MARPALQHAVRLCQLPDQRRGDRAADVQLQQPLRGLPEVPRAGLAERRFDPELVLPDAGMSLAAGAIAPWRDDSPAVQKKRQAQLSAFLTKAGIAWDAPLAAALRETTPATALRRGSRFHGVLNLLEKEYATTGSEPKRRRLETFRAKLPCPECGGSRLRPEARWVRIAGRAIHEVTAMTVVAARGVFCGAVGSGVGHWRLGRGGTRGAGRRVRSTEYGVRSTKQELRCPP